MLFTRDRERSLETGFGFCCIPLHQGDFTGDPMNLCLPPPFSARRHSIYGFANAAPGKIELIKSGIGSRKA